MDFQPDTVVPGEPSTLALLVTGMLTITAYLAITGKWHLLFKRASQAPIELSRPVDPARLVLLGSNGQYSFCRYESQFAHSLAKIISAAEDTDSDYIVRRPSDMRIAPCQMAPRV
jgi:hypothetical protein